MGRQLRWVTVGLVGVVLGAMVSWAVASQTLRSPADLAAEAEAPEPGPVTVPVEQRVLEAEVVVRGTVTHEEPIEVALAGQPALDGADGQAVVTWAPDEDTEIAEGDVVVEISGRPVVALAGELPAYRDLRPGAAGDDVAQLQEALRRLGHLDGEADGEFGAATRRGVESLYEQLGHDAPGPSAEQQEQLRGGQEQVSSARGQVRQAQQRLAEARRGPGEVELLEAEQQVAAARHQVEASEPGSAERRDAEQALALAEARLAELRAEPDTSVEAQALVDAQREFERARQRLAEWEAESGTWLPAGEVAVVPELPQRVDEVKVSLGDEASGTLLTVSSPRIVVVSSVPADDAQLVDEGDPVVIGGDGQELDGVVAEVAERPGTNGVDDDRHHVRVEPEADASELIGTSLRVRIPVESTRGKVLAVPLAAVSAGADGTSRVEVAADPDSDGEAATRLVAVEPGLATDGMVEITPLDGEVTSDDLVVVGQQPTEDHDDVTEDASDGADEDSP